MRYRIPNPILLDNVPELAGQALDCWAYSLEAERNAARCTIQWQFTSQKARTKLVDRYPIKQT
jgi:hypothetical protein